MSKKITLEGLDHFKDKENAMIAGKPESTNTATVAHAVGEYFYWKGVLHIVTAAIAVGGTIQANTNVKPAVLADDVSDLKESISNSEIALPFTVAIRGYFVSWVNGSISGSTRYAATDYIPLNLYRALKYKQIRIEQSSSSAGIAFYDENKQYISGISVQVYQGAGTFSYDSALVTAVIPTNAKYVRCTIINDEETYGTFGIYGISPILYQSILDTALIAPRLNNMQAIRALSVNDLRIVDNTLYRVTAPIAAGGQLIIGTNVVSTSVATILKTLLE